jgi:phosphatidate cytidylyltransferase
MLVVIYVYMLFFEWPALVRSFSYPLLVTALYPLIPMLSLLWLLWDYYASCPLLVLYPFIIAWAADIGGYAAGKIFGTHALCPQISPKKTWEGFAGSVLAVTAVNYVLVFMGNVPFLCGAQTMGTVLACSLIMAIFALCGDIFVSWLKRRAQLKDTGAVLPGHGGLLDRFDSVFCVALLCGVIQFFMHLK